MKMKADDFLIWAEAQDGRWELHDGAVVAMSPERVSHVRTKGLVFQALTAAISRARLPCEAFSDGVSVRVADGSVYEPDAVVHCGSRLPEDAIEVSNPIIVVEVVSPSTAARDHGVKLAGYFSLAGVAHYLILDPERRVVIHHKRGSGEVIETRILSSGALHLDPPGLEVTVADIFVAPQPSTI